MGILNKSNKIIVAGRVHGRFKTNHEDIILYSSVLLGENRSINFHKVHIVSGLISQNNLKEIAQSIRLYVDIFACEHYWHIESPSDSNRRTGRAKYSDGFCFSCNSMRKKFVNVLPRPRQRFKNHLIMIHKSQDIEKQKLLANFTSFCVKDGDTMISIRKR